MTYHRIKFSDGQIESFCKKNRIVRFAFFGSILRDDFGPESDVDILVEFAENAGIGFFEIAGMEHDLSEAFGRRSEIHTYKGLHPLFKEEVIRSAEVLYEQA